ncbi:hypothetical protein JCM10207_004792 [Rhodosporidiobolus poonsookiae]
MVWSLTWEGLDMVVKGGSTVMESEARMTELARELTGLPIPKVYGVLHDGDSTLIYFEKLPGTQLDLVFDHFSDEKRRIVKKELLDSFSCLRATAPNGSHGAHGLVGGCPPFSLSAICAYYPISPPPIHTARELHAYLQQEFFRAMPQLARRYKKEIAPQLTRHHRAPLILVHGNLHPGNILIDNEGRVCGVLDWERAGWYPAWVESYVLLLQCLDHNRPVDFFVAEAAVGCSPAWHEPDEPRGLGRYKFQDTDWMSLAARGWLYRS